MFWNKEEKKEWKAHTINLPPPPPKEVQKIQAMLKQVEVWINLGEAELAEKHWNLISDEARRYGS